MTLIKDGYLSDEELATLPGVPSMERMLKGPVAVIECAQEIPCNPCVTICTKFAISIPGSLTGLPRIHEGLCIGCSLCIPICPGQAIFVVDGSYSASEALVKVPYEYLPLPQVGETVNAVGRDGQYRCDAKVLQVVNNKRVDHTPIVTLLVPKDLMMVVRSLRLKR